MSVLSFAYGSNLDADQVRQRLGDGTLTPVGVAELAGWALAFNKHSDGDGTHKANIIPSPSGRVLGCVDDLSDAQLESLAKYEPGYETREVAVTCRGAPRTAKTFVSAATCGCGHGPSPAYLGVIIRGARAVGLDREYIEQAEALAGGR
jgi:hypothetical protein